MLLGLIRENPTEVSHLFGNPSSAHIMAEEMRAQATFGAQHRVSSELPLSMECKRILALASEEADRVKEKIGVPHLLLGILREEDSQGSKILRKHGLDLQSARERLDRR